MPSTIVGKFSLKGNNELDYIYLNNPGAGIDDLKYYITVSVDDKKCDQDKDATVSVTLSIQNTDVMSVGSGNTKTSLISMYDREQIGISSDNPTDGTYKIVPTP